LCVNYRKLNNRTINHCYLLPLIQETQLNSKMATWYAKCDSRDRYIMFYIAEENERKIVF
ncbi:hypothetical protein K440DRAFT_500463, partial [Wilcoxina mikolae CBS 423.85]